MVENKELMDKFSKVSLLLRRNNRKKNIEAFGDPCRGQSKVLTLLRKYPQISQKELSNMLDIRSQSLGELLLKLERNGYIIRTPSDEDRRSMDIELTSEGKSAADRLENCILDSVKLFDCLNDEEKILFNDYLCRLIDNLESNTGNGFELEQSKDFDCSYSHIGHYREENHCRAGDDGCSERNI